MSADMQDCLLLKIERPGTGSFFMKRSAGCAFMALLAASLASLSVYRDARAGGSADTVTVRVTGSALSSITSNPQALSPIFSQVITDYIWRCHQGINSVELTLTAVSGGSITVGGRSGTSLIVPESLIENQAVIVSAPDATSAGGRNQY